MININNDDLLDTKKNRSYVVVIGATRSTKVQYWDQGLYIVSLWRVVVVDGRRIREFFNVYVLIVVGVIPVSPRIARTKIKAAQE